MNPDQYPATRGDRRSGLSYVAGIPPQTSVWPPGMAPLPPLPWSGRGRPPKLMRRDAEHRPVSVKAVALGLPAAGLAQRSPGARAAPERLILALCPGRVRAAHRDVRRTEPRGEEWLLIEWPEGEAEPAKYWLVRPSRRTCPSRLVDLAKLALADRARLSGAQTGTRASHTTRDAAGAASTITPRCASRPTAS